MLTVATGMAYSLWWSPVVQHHPMWITPGDFWATVRAAHFVGWGDLGGVYSATGVVVTFPGLLVVLAPLVMLGGHLGLAESYPYYLPHPSSWLLYGPVEIALSCFALFGLDALAERLGAGSLRRAFVLLVAAVVLWQVPVIWGHPEDAIALGCAAYGLVAATDERFVAAAWWFGAGLAFQPLVGLMYPVVLGAAGWRRWASMIPRTILVPGFLVAVPLAANFSQAFRSLVTQPTYPTNPNAHDTPLLALATRLTGPAHKAASALGSTITYPKKISARALEHFPGLAQLNPNAPGKLHAGASHLPAVVSGGTPRLGAVLVALVLMWWVARYRHEPAMVAWAAAAALAARPVFEAVEFPYYLAPGLAALLAVSAATSRWRLGAGVAVGLGATLLAYHHLGSWPWWLAITVATVALGYVSFPRWRAQSISPAHSPLASSAPATLTD